MAEEEQPIDKDQVRLSIELPLTLPLGRREMAMLRDPWNELYVYEEFCIFCPWYVGAAQALVIQRLLGQADSENTMDHVDTIKAGLYLAHECALPPPRNKLIYDPDELRSPTDATWGATLLMRVITKDPGLLQAWQLRNNFWQAASDHNYVLAAKSYITILQEDDEEIKEGILLACKAHVKMAKYDTNLIDYVADKSRPFWIAGKPAPRELFDRFFEEFNNGNKNKFAAARAEEDASVEKLRALSASKKKNQPGQKGVRIISLAAQDPLSRMIAGAQKENVSIEEVGSGNEMAEAIQKAVQQVATIEASRTHAPDTGSENMAELKTETKKEEVKFTNVSVMYVEGGDKAHIQLPKGMTYQQAREWLTTIEKEETRTFAFAYKFKSWFPFDAMWAVYRSLTETFGFAHVADFQNWWGPTPPSSVTIDIGFGTKQQIPWGPIQVHGISAPLTPNIEFDNGLPCLTLAATIKNNERGKVDAIMAKAENILETSSIYRGRAVEVDFTVFSPRDLKFDVARAPKFLDTNVNESDLILPEEVRALIETNIWTPIRNTAVCREHQIPLRRSSLLAGKYGVGKSLASQITARICQDNGWTFLYLRNLNQLSQALFFAKKYEPCVVFAEDINRVVSGDRDAEMDAIFNVVDGIDRKNDEVMMILTTNEADKIHPGMLRPGRIDSIITITPPDAVAAAKLVRHYGRNIIDPTADLSHVGEMLAGQIPAIIREAVERSKLAAIGDTKPGEKLVVRPKHLEVAAYQLLEHAKLLVEPPAAKPDIILLGEAIGQIIGDGMRMKELSGTNKELVPLAPTAVMDAAGRPSNGNGKHSNPSV